MTLESDLLLDRRRLKRRLVVWRVLALAAVAAAIVAAAGVEIGGRTHIARLSVSGIITENRKLTEAVDALAEDGDVPALIVFVNSPGGSVAGGESLHNAIARVAAKKPVVAVMGGTAASAGYMVSVPAARIFARESTLTGSIGVLMQTGEVSGLLDRLGVTAEAITSGPLKDQPSYTRPLTAQGRDVLHGLVMDLYEQFVGMVAAGRHLPVEKVHALADGRAYTGHQALQLGLVDEIGGEPEARAWLAKEHKISADLPVTDVEIGSFAERTLGARFGAVLDVIGKMLSLQRVTVDGALALWQPSGR